MLGYSICYAASYGFARMGWYLPSGGVLFLAAGYLYYKDYHKSGNLVHLRGVFCAFWTGGQAMACLKLSNLQSSWSLLTWACFYVALSGFWWTYELADRLLGEEYGRRRQAASGSARPLFRCMEAVTVVSVAAFVLEASVLKYFSGGRQQTALQKCNGRADDHHIPGNPHSVRI